MAARGTIAIARHFVPAAGPAIATPATDPDRYARVWLDHVFALADAYQMAE